MPTYTINMLIILKMHNVAKIVNTIACTNLNNSFEVTVSLYNVHVYFYSVIVPTIQMHLLLKANIDFDKSALKMFPG